MCQHLSRKNAAASTHHQNTTDWMSSKQQTDSSFSSVAPSPFGQEQNKKYQQNR